MGTVEKIGFQPVTLPPSAVTENGVLQKGLHQDGRRLTPQRKRVLELFERLAPILSAEDVHQQLAQLQMKVSLATVYRTLRLLVWVSAGAGAQ